MRENLFDKYIPQPTPYVFSDESPYLILKGLGMSLRDKGVDFSITERKIDDNTQYQFWILTGNYSSVIFTMSFKSGCHYPLIINFCLDGSFKIANKEELICQIIDIITNESTEIYHTISKHINASDGVKLC